MPVVATRDPRIKLVVIWAGPAMDYAPELVNEVEENVKAMGLGGDELEKALEFKRQALIMLADGDRLNDEACANSRPLSVLTEVKNGFLRGRTGAERLAPKEALPMAQIKSSEFCRQVKIPVLAPYGGKDLNVLAAKNMTALTAELRAGNRDFTIKVFPDANHDGFETTDLILDGEQARYLTRLVPGLVKQACFAQKWGIASERNLFIPNIRRWNRGIC